MKSKIQYWIRTIAPRSLFTLDAAGAFLSLALAILAAQFEALLGIQSQYLYFLAAWISIYFVCSSTFALLNAPKWRGKLKFIASANALYCPVSLAVIFISRDTLSLWGLLYLGGEMMIVATIAAFEWKVAQRAED